MSTSSSWEHPGGGEPGEPRFIDRIIEEGGFTAEPAAVKRGEDIVKAFVAQVLRGSMATGRNTQEMIHARIKQIDDLISLQLNEILHHPGFQTLESAWRGLVI